MGNWVGNYYVQFWVPQLKKDVEKLEKVYWGVNKMIRVLGYMTITSLVAGLVYFGEEDAERGSNSSLFDWSYKDDVAILLPDGKIATGCGVGRQCSTRTGYPDLFKFSKDSLYCPLPLPSHKLLAEVKCTGHGNQFLFPLCTQKSLGVFSQLKRIMCLMFLFPFYN